MAANSGNGPTVLPLVAPLQSRKGELRSDNYIANGIIERDLDGQTRVYKRPSLASVFFAVTGTGQGIYLWLGSLYTVIGGNLYKDNTLLGAVGSGRFWFQETLGTPAYLYLSNGTDGYTVTSAGVFAKIVDATYTGTIGLTVQGAAYLDGTLYVMDPKAQIWGSKNLNDPTVWDALNLIRAQIEPDAGVAIVKQDIYVVALKRWTTEFFYDAASPTGSPLLPVQNAKLSIGCFNANSVAFADDILFWVSVNRSGELAVVRCEKTKAEIISTPDISRILTRYSGFGVQSAWVTKYDGRLLYGLRFLISSSVSTTIVYDDLSKNWSYWDYNGGEFPFYYYASTDGSNTFFGQTVFQNSDGLKYILSAGLPGDVNSSGGPRYPVKLEIVTPIFDGGTRLEKVFSRLLLQCDQASAGALEVCWSDDDYQSWTPWVTVSLADTTPQLNDLGTARKRAFRFRHQSPTFVRLLAAELDVLVGSV